MKTVDWKSFKMRQVEIKCAVDEKNYNISLLLVLIHCNKFSDVHSNNLNDLFLLFLKYRFNILGWVGSNANINRELSISPKSQKLNAARKSSVIIQIIVMNAEIGAL